MKQVLVLVEGQSEEIFVARTLAPYLWTFDVHPQPTIIATRRVRSGADFKGGVNSWNQVRRDVILLLGDSGAAAVTTMLDYYGLPSDVPGMTTKPIGTALNSAVHVEESMDAAIGDARFTSNLLLHEFEALLYAGPITCGDYLGSPRLAEVMQEAVNLCGGPELVNDSPMTAPSKRILAVHAQYRKTLDGPSLIDAIGLDAIRNACPHFDEWVGWLESL